MYDLAKFYFPKSNIIQLKDLSGKDREQLAALLSTLVTEFDSTES
jgi:hypothetical protein